MTTPTRKAKPINFSPYASNVLDYVGRTDLVTSKGQPVEIKQDMRGAFVVVIDYSRYDALGNLDASMLLNNWQVGVKL